MSSQLKDWVAYYDSAHSIYVNAVHRDVHYARMAEEIAGYVPSPVASVLDYGCGEALHADRIAAVCAQLTLADAAPSVRAHLIERFARTANIAVVSPEKVAAMPAPAFDLIVFHSVSQYLSGEEFDAIATLFRRLLKPEGVFLIGDVVPPNVPAISDAFALLRFGAGNGFFLAALAGPRAHRLLRLLAAAHEARADPLQRAGHDGAARAARLHRDAGPAQHRSSPGADDVPCAAGGGMKASPNRHFCSRHVC